MGSESRRNNSSLPPRSRVVGDGVPIGVSKMNVRLKGPSKGSVTNSNPGINKPVMQSLRIIGLEPQGDAQPRRSTAFKSAVDSRTVPQDDHPKHDPDGLKFPSASNRHRHTSELEVPSLSRSTLRSQSSLSTATAHACTVHACATLPAQAPPSRNRSVRTARIRTSSTCCVSKR